MELINNIINKLEEFAPPELAEKWDNSGWQVQFDTQEITKVMLALTPSADVIESARKCGCELLITHHPMYYTSLNHHNLQIYAAHTNLDFAQNGIRNHLLNILSPENEEPLEFFINKLKQQLNVATVKLINPDKINTVKKIDVMPGSGGGLINSLKDIDVYITGDVKYHDAMETKGFAVIDAGHFDTERIILPVLKDLLREFSVEIYIAEETSPWVYV